MRTLRTPYANWIIWPVKDPHLQLEMKGQVCPENGFKSFMLVAGMPCLWFKETVLGKASASIGNPDEALEEMWDLWFL